MITLGGNIKLEGFETLDPASMIIVKKMVGLFAKKAFEKLGTVDSFEVTKVGADIAVRILSKEFAYEGAANDSNLFMALSNALKQAEEKAAQ